MAKERIGENQNDNLGAKHTQGVACFTGSLLIDANPQWGRYPRHGRGAEGGEGGGTNGVAIRLLTVQSTIAFIRVMRSMSAHSDVGLGGQSPVYRLSNSYLSSVVLSNIEINTAGFSE